MSIFLNWAGGCSKIPSMIQLFYVAPSPFAKRFPACCSKADESCFNENCTTPLLLGYKAGLKQ